MTTIPVIVQARMGSTRLPGKVMKMLRGKTFLEHCLDRCAMIENISDVIVATTDGPDCNAIADLARRRGYRVFRGSQEDVLSRYIGAAQEVKADAVIRITSDCPLIDPTLGTQVLTKFMSSDYDLVTTNIPPSWPTGMDLEVVTMSALEEAGREHTAKSEREHVTTFIRRRPARYQMFNFPCPIEGVAHWRMTLDTPEDQAFFVKLAEVFPGDLESAGFQELFDFIAARLEICTINTDEQL
jgi:spore coat polysaccharide biosynthesis protein SpsF